MSYLFIIIFIFIVVIVLVAELSKKGLPTSFDPIKERGREGEHIVNYYLNVLQNKGKVLKNLYIPTVHGQTTEIDNLLLTRDAIFVIESKNINGIIRGSEDSEKWVSIRDDRTKEFRNPVKQNATHVKYLKNQIKQLIPIYSIIAFDDEANLYGIKIDNSHIKVIHYKEIVKTINYELRDECHFLNEGQFQTAYQKLKKFTEVSDEIKKQHDRFIRENYK